MMPPVKPPHGVQELLFPDDFRDFPFSTSASARTFYGAAIEEIACAILKLNPMETDARYKTCYDAERNGRFYEIKSVKRTGGCIIFKKRLDNDAEANVPLSYVFVSHNVSGARSNRQLWTELSKIPLVIWIVPFYVVQSLCATLPIRKHYTSPDHGAMRYGYEKGYHVLPLSRLCDLPRKSRHEDRRIYDFNFRSDIHELF